jgi:DNA segregation ATPase FtsK/SpoIIIE, S-DNA-T family
MAYQRIDQTPLLPAALRNRLGRWLLRATGSSVLLGCAACSLALMTWSAADPSLSHVTNGAIRNVLGSVGAILADLLMQLLGLAGVLIVLPPLLWALPLSSGRPLRGWRSKFALAPVAVVAMAGALSALPTSITWTLHHGNGGMIGDLAFTGLAGTLALLNADKAGLAAGLLLLAGGVLALLGSLGLSQHEWRQILAYPGSTRLERLTGTWRTLGQWLPTLPKPPLPHRLVSMRQEPPMYRNAYRSAATRAGPEVAGPAEPALSPPIAATARAEEPLEEPIDPSSRAIAERFAPAGKPSAAPSLNERLPLLAPAPLARELPTEPALSRPGPTSYRRPPLAILKRQPAPKASDQLTQSALLGHARLLSDVLADFGIKGEIKGAHPGPVVTLFEFEPARGTKSARVIALADDIARSMSAVSVRVAVVPGRNVIGIELPNLRREKVYLRELVETEAFRDSTASLPLVLGKSIGGAPVFADLARMPHLLVAGTTGAGKSVGVNAMILSLLYRLSPQECRFLMIDPKMLELSVYNGVPHLLCPVVTDPHKAVTALNWAVREMEQRYERMSRLGVRHIDAFNARVRHGKRREQGGAEEEFSPLPYIVVVVDEFADLMLVAGKEIESAVQRLAQMARAAGIHLIMATQRPSVDVITGTIKANFPTRISFKVASKFDSRTILNDQGAEQLLGQGDMLFSGGSDRLMRVHGPFVSDEEVEGMAAYLREQGTPCYIPGITDLPEEEAETLDGAQQTEALYDRAVGIVVRDGKPSISYLQRRLSIGYNRAAGLIERMEREGVIGPAADGGRRQILLGLPAPARPVR